MLSCLARWASLGVPPLLLVAAVGCTSHSPNPRAADSVSGPGDAAFDVGGADGTGITPDADTLDSGTESDGGHESDSTATLDVVGGPDACADNVCPELWTCLTNDAGDPTCDLLPESLAVSQATFDALSAGLAASLPLPDRPEDTLGTLTLGLHPHVVPIVTTPEGVLVAASTLGAGRVVAFSGEDFLGSQTRSRLLDEESVARLLGNAVSWTGNGGTGRVLVDNDAIGAALATQNILNVDVAPSASGGERRVWPADLSAYSVLAVQANEWGTSRLDPNDLPRLRAFVQGGGGLLIAGSALHWSWWLTHVAADFPGNTLIAGAGISWKPDAIRDLSPSTVAFDAESLPLALWHAYATGAEVSPSGYMALGGLFASAVEAGLDVDTALERLITETPALPVAASVPTARLAADVIRTMGPHVWPTPHPWAKVFPGAVPDDAPRVEEQPVTVNRHYVGPVPLGLYAPAGEVVVITVDPAVAALGITIEVGELHDDLFGVPDITTWARAPVTYRTFPLNAAEVSVGSPLGGTLYAVLPDGPDVNDSVIVRVSGAVMQPLYVHGQTTDWTSSRMRPAPQAILEYPGKVRLSVDSSAIRTEADPGSIMEYWSGFFDSHAALAQEPTPRRRASHMIFDVQVGWGYANATTERINHPKLAEAWALRRDLDSEDIWLFGHEMGHQFQTDNWSGGDVTEVCVNLFTMYTLNGYRNGGGDRETRGHKGNVIDHVALKALRWPTADLFEKLEMYRELVFEFGWSVYQQVFASYYSADFSDTEDGMFMDGFAIRFSRIVGRDLTGFFDNWQYPMSAEARSKIASLGLPPWLPPGW